MRGILRFLRTTPRHPGNHCPHRLVIVAAHMQMTVKLECRRPPQRTWSLSWTRTVSSAIADLLPLDGGEPVPETCLVECWFLESSQHPPHCITEIRPPSIRPSTSILPRDRRDHPDESCSSRRRALCGVCS